MKRAGVIRVLKALWKGAVATFGAVFGGFSAILRGLLGFVVFVAVSGLMVALIGYLAVKPQLDSAMSRAYDILATADKSDFRALSDTEVFDSDNNVVGTINAGHFEYADINNISLNIQNGYIAQEDRRFKEHIGIDAIAIARAGLSLFKHNGEITQGGSTITQQVIKNAFLTQEQTFKRKLVEVLLAPQIEKKFSKADIMEFYCNTNYYSNRCYGVESASKYFFGKSAKDLSIWEAATLVGISNSPSAYDPVKNPEKCKEKRNQVLGSMQEVGFIGSEEYERAIKEPLTILQQTQEGTDENYQVSYAVQSASLELMKLDGFNFKYTFESKEDYDNYMGAYSDKYKEYSDKIRSGGYKIYTTLDSKLQGGVQASIDAGLSQFTELQDNGKYAMQGAAVLVDNETNYVVAIVGGRGTEDQFNRAYLSARQPGSAIKPLLDYGPALDTGEYFPSKIVNDHKWEGGPSNSSNSYRGNVTVREALNRSLNTVAWQILQEVGVRQGVEYLGKMEFQKISYIDSTVEAVSIGGFTTGLRVVDMAKGYSTLANNGTYSDKTCIRAIDFQDNGDLLKFKKDRTEQVYQADTAYMITDMLKGTINESYGTGHGLALSTGMPVAGKTGTTNSSKDTWFCGYSPYYSVAVWVGYDTPRPMPGVYGATYAGKIWQSIMEKANSGKELKDWSAPSTVVLDNYQASTGNRVEHETGHKDLFSITGEIRAKQAEYEKEQLNLSKKVESEVAKFESFQISSVEDTYKVDETSNNLTALIAGIEEEELRNPLLKRVASKHESLNIVVSGMQEEIKLYEESKEKQQEQARKQEELNSQKAREEELKRLKVQSFTDSVTDLNNLKYTDSNTDFMVETARTRLKDLALMPEYDKYYKQLATALKRVTTLADKGTWEIAEAKRVQEEAEAESRAQAEAESRAQEKDKELESIKKPSSPSTEESGIEIGPGVTN